MRKIGNFDFSTKPTNYYIFDVIISVGYHVHPYIGPRCRSRPGPIIWIRSHHPRQDHASLLRGRIRRIPCSTC